MVQTTEGYKPYKERKKKGFTALFYPEIKKDKEIIEKIEIVQTVGGYTARDILIEGLKAKLKSSDFQEKLKRITERMDLIREVRGDGEHV